MTEDELRRLLCVARRRPLAEHGRDTIAKPRQQPGKRRDTWVKAPLTLDTINAAEHQARLKLIDNPDLIERLNMAGKERELLYKTLLLTGLRKGELVSLTVAQVDLDAEVPYLVLNASDEKSRHGSDLPIPGRLGPRPPQLAGRETQGLAGEGSFQDR